MSLSDIEKKVRRRSRDDAAATLQVDAATGRWELHAEDGLVKQGNVVRDGTRFTITVPLSYDPSAYFDALVDRKRARDRADQLRAALADIAGAEDIEEAIETARAALENPFELAVRDEQEEDGV